MSETKGVSEHAQKSTISDRLQKNNNSYVALKIISIGNTIEEHYDIKSTNITALQLLKNKHNVTLNLGDNAVKCIDNVCAESGYWWPMYVNEKISTLGVNNYHVKRSDSIEFRFAKK